MSVKPTKEAEPPPPLESSSAGSNFEVDELNFNTCPFAIPDMSTSVNAPMLVAPPSTVDTHIEPLYFNTCPAALPVSSTFCNPPMSCVPILVTTPALVAVPCNSVA